MNDFTKFELETIAEELEGTIYRVLREKVQSKIDNYCEHDWQNHCCGCVDMTICEKCNQRLIPDE